MLRVLRIALLLPSVVSQMAQRAGHLCLLQGCLGKERLLHALVQRHELPGVVQRLRSGPHIGTQKPVLLFAALPPLLL